jgi:hypothetical protein
MVCNVFILPRNLKRNVETLDAALMQTTGSSVLTPSFRVQLPLHSDSGYGAIDAEVIWHLLT